jgi:hypothetical protein
MKHILNDLTEQEKNAIREQHSGGMKVMTENFSRLLNSKLGDSKPLVSEQSSNMEQTIEVYDPKHSTPYLVVIQGKGKKVGASSTLEFTGHIAGQWNQTVQIQCMSPYAITVFDKKNNLVLNGHNKDVISKFCSVLN